MSPWSQPYSAGTAAAEGLRHALNPDGPIPTANGTRRYVDLPGDDRSHVARLIDLLRIVASRRKGSMVEPPAPEKAGPDALRSVLADLASEQASESDKEAGDATGGGPEAEAAAKRLFLEILKGRGQRLEDEVVPYCDALVYPLAGVADRLFLRAKKTLPLDFFAGLLVANAELQIEEELERWERKKNPIEAKLTILHHDEMNIQAELNEVESRAAADDLQPPFPHREVKLWAYLLSQLLLVGGETYFNFVSIQALFPNLPRWQIILIVLGPATAIPVLAHFLGSSLRQWNRRPDAGFKAGFVLFVCLTALLLGLAALAILRALHTGIPGQLNWAGALPLSAINLGVLAAATFVAFFAHDPIPEREALLKRKRALERKLRGIFKAWERLARKYDRFREVTIHRIAVIGQAADTKLAAYGLGIHSKVPSLERPTSLQNGPLTDFLQPRAVGAAIDPIPSRTKEGEKALRRLDKWLKKAASSGVTALPGQAESGQSVPSTVKSPGNATSEKPDQASTAS